MLVRKYYNALAAIVLMSTLSSGCGQQFNQKNNDDKVAQNQVTFTNDKISSATIGAQGEFYGTISIDNKGACGIQNGNVGDLLTCGTSLNEKNQTTINLAFSSLGLKNAPTCTYGVFSPITRLPSIDKLTPSFITLSFAGNSSSQPQCPQQPCCQPQPCGQQNCCQPSFPQPQPLPPPPWGGCQSNCTNYVSTHSLCPSPAPIPAPSYPNPNPCGCQPQQPPCGCQPQQPPCGSTGPSSGDSSPLQLQGQTLTFHCDIAE